MIPKVDRQDLFFISDSASKVNSHSYTIKNVKDYIPIVANSFNIQKLNYGYILYDNILDRAIERINDRASSINNLIELYFGFYSSYVYYRLKKLDKCIYIINGMVYMLGYNKEVTILLILCIKNNIPIARNFKLYVNHEFESNPFLIHVYKKFKKDIIDEYCKLKISVELTTHSNIKYILNTNNTNINSFETINE